MLMAGLYSYMTSCLCFPRCFSSFLLVSILFCKVFFFFKQKTAYEMRISDWSSDVCSSDLSMRSISATRARARTMPSQGQGLVSKEIGRASCRESVSVRVDLGGRRIIKKKKIQTY